jgi:transcriptional regulator
MPPRTNADQLHGTLDMLVLKVLQGGPQHGFGIAVRLQQLSSDVLQVEEGSLYPALYRMEQRGWIAADWGTSELGRKAKFYKITAAGRKRLAASTAEWARFSAAISKVLQTV